MERTLTLVLTILCLAPAFFLAFAWLVWKLLPTNNADQGIATGYLGLLAGTVAVIAGSIATYYYVQHYLFPMYLRQVQLADALIFAGWIVVIGLLVSRQTQKLDYGDQKGKLQVELRADHSLLNNQSIDSMANFSFVGGNNVTSYHPDNVRRETGFQILAWESTILDVRRWEVLVFWREDRILFELDLPKRPAQSTEWSAWIQPVRQENYAAPDGLTLRYRFRLVPYTQ
jgi:hypothetical protein